MFFRNTSFVGFRVDLPSYGNSPASSSMLSFTHVFQTTLFKAPIKRVETSDLHDAHPVRLSRIRVCWPQRCLLPPLSRDRSRARHDRPGTWNRSIEHRLKRLFFVRMTLLHPITGGPDHDSWSSAPRQPFTIRHARHRQRPCHRSRMPPPPPPSLCQLLDFHPRHAALIK